MLTDLELIEEIAGDNMAAFRTLYYRHVDHVFGLVTRIMGPCRADIEDVVQEVFVQTFRSLSNFQGHAKFSTWLHRVALNVCYSQLRRVSSCDIPAEEKAHSQHVWGVSEDQIDARRKVAEIYRLIDAMPTKNRMVFVLREFQGLTLAEIAETLDTPLNTVASRLRRSREALMRSLAETVSQDKGEER